VAQKAIGLLFAMMVMFHVGFLLADKPVNMGGYLDAQGIVGWMQLVCLLMWGVDDAAGRAYRRDGPDRDQVPARRGD
jgi:hypothetical protein